MLKAIRSQRSQFLPLRLAYPCRPKLTLFSSPLGVKITEQLSLKPADLRSFFLAPELQEVRC